VEPEQKPLFDTDAVTKNVPTCCEVNEVVNLPAVFVLPDEGVSVPPGLDMVISADDTGAPLLFVTMKVIEEDEPGLIKGAFTCGSIVNHSVQIFGITSSVTCLTGPIVIEGAQEETTGSK